jgi:hypothetical protein
MQPNKRYNTKYHNKNLLESSPPKLTINNEDKNIEKKN